MKNMYEQFYLHSLACVCILCEGESGGLLIKFRSINSALKLVWIFQGVQGLL